MTKKVEDKTVSGDDALSATEAPRARDGRAMRIFAQEESIPLLDSEDEVSHSLAW